MASGQEVAVERVRGVDDNMMRSHFHDYFEIYLLESGSRHHVGGDTVYQIHDGELIIFPPYTMHRSFGQPGVAFDRVVLYFDPSAILVPDLAERLHEDVRVYRPGRDCLQDIRRAIARLLDLQDQHEEFVDQERSLLLNQVLVRLVRQPPTDAVVEQEDRLSAVIRYLQDHHAEQITLEDLASRFYISRFHLCRQFKKYTGTTVVQYVKAVRIGQAQRLLTETTMPVIEVSKAVGFANVTHFNRVFRSHTAMSPSQYRHATPHRLAPLSKESP